MKDYKRVNLLLRDTRVLAPVSTERGQQLVMSMAIYEMTQPTITVELCTKWYELFLLTNGNPKRETPGDILDIVAYSIHFGHLDETRRPVDMTPFVDHVPNPYVVRLFARQNNYEIDELAYDLIYGRWEHEVKEWNWMECERCQGSGQVAISIPLPAPYETTCRRCKGDGFTKPMRG